MATVRIPDEQRTLTDQDEVTRYLATLGIDYERWPDAERRAASMRRPRRCSPRMRPRSSSSRQQGGYVTADVIDVTAQTPNLEAMLAKFSTEHWHDEDEVRFIVRGRGIFHVHPETTGPVIAIEVEAGDLIRVPRGTWHWFDLCGDRDIRAIRLFQDKSGWTPHYTDSGADKGYQPLCIGPSYIPAAGRRRAEPASAPSCWTSRAPPRRSISSTKRCLVTPTPGCGFPRAPLDRSRGPRPTLPGSTPSTLPNHLTLAAPLAGQRPRGGGLRPLADGAGPASPPGSNLCKERSGKRDIARASSRARSIRMCLPALERWRNQGIGIAIFSSGSVQAQQSLFKNTTPAI